MSPQRRRVHPRLASARAYWRLARKSEIAGSQREADRYRATGDRMYALYQRATRKPS